LQREKQKGKAKAKRVRVVAAARQSGHGRVQVSLAAKPTQFPVGVRPVGVVAPRVSEFWQRVQGGASRLFVF